MSFQGLNWFISLVDCFPSDLLMQHKPLGFSWNQWNSRLTSHSLWLLDKKSRLLWVLQLAKVQTAELFTAHNNTWVILTFHGRGTRNSVLVQGSFSSAHYRNKPQSSYLLQQCWTDPIPAILCCFPNATWPHTQWSHYFLLCRAAMLQFPLWPVIWNTSPCTSFCKTKAWMLIAYKSLLPKLGKLRTCVCKSF